MRLKKSSQGSMVIMDEDHLALFLRKAVERRGKTATAVAEECGISQGQFSRLLGGKLKRVSVGTYQRLRSIPDAEVYFELPGLFLSEDARKALSAIEEQLAEWERRLEAKVGLTEEERELVRELAEEYPKVRRALEKLHRVYNKRQHTYVRWVAALRDVLQPLNRFFTTLGVERGFHELSKDELATFVVHGLERERILLDREPDLVRAQQAAENLPRLKAALKGRTAHFGVGRPYCWDFVRPRGHLTLEEFGAIADSGAGTAADPHVFDTPSPLLHPRPRQRK